MTNHTPWRKALPAAAAVAALMAAAMPAAAIAQSQIVVAQSSDTRTLDPSIDTSPISLNLFQNIYDQLTQIAADGSVQPRLATEWTSNADSTEWTFTLRDGVTFHDGSPLTAEDVVWTYQKIMADETSPVRAYLKAVASVEQVGDNKVQFKLNAPFSPWPRQVTLVSILPSDAYQAAGAEGFNTKPIGSGPFSFVSWVKDDAVTLQANDAYFGGKPAIDRLIFRPVPSESARVAGLLSGELDVVPLLPPALVERLSGANGVKVETVASNRVLYIGFDTNTAPYDDVNLRLAIDHAIDRTAISDKLLRGLGKPMGQLVAPVTFGYDDAIAPTPFDQAKAREYLAKSNYKGEELTFLYPNNRYAFGSEVAQAIGGYLSQVGINVKLEGMEYAAYFPMWLKKQLNSIHMFGFGPSIMDAELPLGSLYASGSRGYWSDARVDDLIARQRAEADPAKRQALISEVWKLNTENVPYSPLYNEIQAYGMNEKLQWAPRPDERLLFGEARLAP